MLHEFFAVLQTVGVLMIITIALACWAVYQDRRKGK